MTAQALAEPGTTADALPEDEVVEQWAKEIARSDFRSVRAVFASHNAQGPEIIWHPSIDQVQLPPLRFLLAHWSKLAGPHGMPEASRIDPIEMRQVLGYVSLMEVIDQGRDFRCRLHGTTVAAVSDYDMTGQYLSDFKASPYIVGFSMACYRAALTRRAPIFTAHSPPADVSRTIWQRLILPLLDETGDVVRFMACNVPTPRDGRPFALSF